MVKYSRYDERRSTMDKMRMLGHNISLDMERKGIDENTFAEKLGYSVYQFHKLLEGKMMIVRKDIERIADCLGETYDELTRKRDRKEYEEMYDCMGAFTDEDNEDLILDIIDMYVEMKERASGL